MTTLNEVTQKRLAQKLTNGEMDAQQAIQSLMQDSKDGQDFFLQLGEGMRSKFHANGSVRLKTPSGDFSLHDNAINQLAQTYDMDLRKLKKMVGAPEQWKKDNIAYNLNDYSIHNPKSRFLMRAVREEIRGVLSDRYKILDSFEILSIFLEQAINKGAKFAGGHNSGLNLYVEVLVPEPIQVDTVNNGVINLIFGARAKTSDFGRGKLMFSVFYMNAVCLNGMVGETILEERHIGEKLPEGFNFSKKVHALDSQRMVQVTKEMTRTMFSEERIANQIMNIRSSSRVEIDAKKYLERLNKENKILKGEAEEAEIVMINNKREDGVDGASTLWKLTQAISAVARDKEPVRQRELMELSGSLLLGDKKELELFNN